MAPRLGLTEEPAPKAALALQPGGICRAPARDRGHQQLPGGTGGAARGVLLHRLLGERLQGRGEPWGLANQRSRPGELCFGGRALIKLKQGHRNQTMARLYLRGWGSSGSLSRFPGPQAATQQLRQQNAPRRFSQPRPPERQHTPPQRALCQRTQPAPRHHWALGCRWVPSGGPSTQGMGCRGLRGPGLSSRQLPSSPSTRPGEAEAEGRGGRWKAGG